MSSTEWMIASQVTCDETLLENRSRPVVDLRILEPDAGKALDDPSVESRVGALVDDRSRVVTLEVDGVHAAELAELRDELFRPVARRVELEAQAWGSASSQPVDGLQRRRLAESHRHHVGERAELAPDGLSERLAGLAEREVERSALECPSGDSRRTRLARAGSRRAPASARCCENESIVHVPASGSTAPRSSCASCSDAS